MPHCKAGKIERAGDARDLHAADRKRTTLGTAVVVLIAVLSLYPRPVAADDRFWIGTSGGDWFDQSKWSTTMPLQLGSSPASVPGLGDIASFMFGGTTYTVGFSSPVNLNQLRVPSDTVTFDLQNQSLVIDGTTHIGNVANDIGGLTLQNGAMTSPVVFVGMESGDGRLVIDANAILNIEGSLNGLDQTFAIGGVPLGLHGTGRLEVFGTLHAHDTDSVVGARLSAIGTAEVNGGTWQTDNSLVIGQDGAEGSVTISNGGIVSTGLQTYVGRSGRTNEFVDVTGSGELNITSGTLTTGATATIGSAENAFGEVDMTGANSAWNISGFLFVGEAGIGNLHVRDESEVHVQNDTFISVGTNEALLNITTLGSFLNDGSMYVGGGSSAAGGPGQLLVQSDGSLVVGGCLKVWDTGTLTIDGGAITANCFEAEPGATLNFDSGTLSINGGPLNVPVDFVFGGTDPSHPPELILLNGTVGSFADLSLGVVPGVSSALSVENATITASDDINIGGDDAGPIGQGRLSMTSGNANAGDLIRIWDQGVMQVESGVVTATDLSITGGLMTVSGPDTAVYIDESGEFPKGIPGIHVGFAPAFTGITMDRGGKLLAPDVDLSIASDLSTLAIANVTGPGSEIVTRNARIGSLGDGTLSVIDEAAAEFHGDLDIAVAPNSVGTVYLENPGTHATCMGRMTVGGQGRGTLHLAAGSSFLSQGDTRIGAQAAFVNAAPGFVVVEGGGWTSEGSIYLGGDEFGAQEGGGEIFLRTGGLIDNCGTLQVWSTGTLSLEGGSLYTRDLLFEDGAGYKFLSGSATVDGGQFRLPTESVVVEGPDEANPMDVSFLRGADAQITLNWSIGSGPGATGATTVAGVSQAGVRSTLLSTSEDGDLVVGAKGLATIDVLDGGLVDFAHDVFVGLQGASIGTMNVGGVSRGQQAELLVTRGATSSLTIGGREGIAGGNGHMTVFDGGYVDVDGDMFVARNAQSIGDVTLFGRNGQISEIQVSDDLFVGGNESTFGGQASVLASSNSVLDVGDTLKLWPDGYVNVDGGTVRANHVDLTDAEDGSFQFFDGRLEANLISGDIENHLGTLAHGDLVGSWTLDGNYTQFDTGTLEFEVLDLNLAAVEDTLEVTGTATLDGTLRVVMHPEFRPPVGERYTVMTFGSRVGEFSRVVSTGLVIFDIEYFDDRIELIVVDSPLGPGDLDHNGFVNLGDYALMHDCMTGPAAAAPLVFPCTDTDLNGDGRVDLRDVSLWQRQHSFEGLPDVARWTAAVGGDWDDDPNWRGGNAPVAGDRVFIDVPGVEETIVHTGRIPVDEPIASLLCNEKLRLEFDSMSVAGPFQMNNTLEMACGLLADTTVDLGPDDVISVVRHICSSAVENVTINGNLDLVTDGAPLISRNAPLTINGNVRIGGFRGSAATGLYFFGANKVLLGNATISFIRSDSTSAVSQSDHGLLHLTSGITIRGAEGRIGRLDQPLIHDGIIDSDAAGEISVSGTGWINNGITRVSGTASELALLGSWTNNGTIEAYNDGTLILGSDGEPFENLGTLTATDATVHLNGEFSIADLGAFDFRRSEVILGGTLLNESGLVLDADQFNWKLGRGTILGGVIDSDDGTVLEVVSATCCGNTTLDGVTLNTDMDVTDPGLFVKLKNGLTLNGTLRINGHTTAVGLFTSNKSITGNGRIEFLSTGTSNSLRQGDGGTMHIGPDITIQGANAVVGVASTQGQTGTLINDGTIHASRTGFFQVAGTDWVNNGTVRMSGGARLRLDNDWTNHGIVDAGVGALDIAGSWVNHGDLQIANGTTVESAADYTQSPSGAFVTTIANADGDGHGKMSVTGTASLDGTLVLEFQDSFDAAAGQSFVVLEYGSRVGAFSSIVARGLDPGLKLVSNYEADFLSITVTAN